jgi:hypothetical protein
VPVHDALTGPDALHPAAFVSATDPALDPANYVGALKWWVDTAGAGPVLKYRDPTNTAWVAVTTTDHGALGGLGDDDHPQYLKLTLVDAKGDLLVATAADTLTRLAVGSIDHVLTVDPSAAAGVVWRAPIPTLVNPMTAPADLIVGGTGGAPTRLASGSAGQVLSVAAGVLTWVTPASAATDLGGIGFTFGDGASAIVAASEPAQWVEVPFDCTITGATLIADVAGSVVVDLQVTDYAGWPADAGDSICASAKPTLAAAIKSQDTTLTGWTTGLTRGHYIRAVLDSAATVKRVVVSVAVEGV